MSDARRHTFFVLLSVALVLFAFTPIRWLAALSLNLGNNHLSYIPTVPFLSAALIYWNRKKIFSKLRTSALPAATAFMISVVLYYASRTIGTRLDENDHLSLTIAALVAAWLGMFLLMYGSVAFKSGLFPLLFVGLIIPVPSRIMNAIVHFLQKGSAETSSLLFMLSGTPAYRKDVTFVLPGLTIDVAEACSGIRSTLAIFIVTLIVAHLLLRSNWRRTALLLAVVPISLVKNAVRIVTLSLLAIRLDMRFMTGSLHQDGGVLFMLLGLCLLYPFLFLLLRSEAKNVDSGVPL
ncbi:MAG: hypothetical protein DMG14_25695 [Acidobacteria bacterium]|nr:MAG: hypothetical protein DMG14_25695 [Acidobacteriota bacterium]